MSRKRKNFKVEGKIDPDKIRKPNAPKKSGYFYDRRTKRRRTRDTRDRDSFSDWE